jgi:hypothetical protein
MAADTFDLAAIGPSLYIKAASVDLKQLFMIRRSPHVIAD